MKDFLVILAFLIPVTVEAQSINEIRGAPERPAIDAFEILKELVETPGVDSEQPIREKVRAFLPAWAKPQIDNKGNLIVTFGSGDEHLMFVGHLDEISYTITDIKEDGTLQLENRLGLYDQYEGHPVVIHTRRGAISGIITPRIRFVRDETSKNNDTVLDVRVYLGTNTKRETEELGIRPGDLITVPKQFVQLANSRATVTAFDHRSGCTAMILALMKLDPLKVKKRITFAWVVEEQIRLNGAQAIADGAKADYVFAVDTFVSSEIAGHDKRLASAPLADAFVIRGVNVSNVTSSSVVNRINGIARRHSIPLQVAMTTNGTSGSTLIRSADTRPGRYYHSPVEVLSKSNLEALSKIIQLLVLEF